MKNDRANLYSCVLKCYDGNRSYVEQCQSSDFVVTVLCLHCTKEPTGSLCSNTFSSVLCMQDLKMLKF